MSRHQGLQWGHGDEAVEEAADGPPPRAAEAALQWGHGDEAVEEPSGSGRSGHISQRFNGATAMKPWKSRERRHRSTIVGKLQWGHGDEAVEEGCALAREGSA